MIFETLPSSYQLCSLPCGYYVACVAHIVAFPRAHWKVNIMRKCPFVSHWVIEFEKSGRKMHVFLMDCVEEQCALWVGRCGLGNRVSDMIGIEKVMGDTKYLLEKSGMNLDGLFGGEEE